MCYCRTLHVLHLTRPTSLITCISYRRTTLLTAGTYPSCVPSAWYNAWHLRDRKNSMTETFKSKAADVKGMEERGQSDGGKSWRRQKSRQSPTSSPETEIRKDEGGHGEKSCWSTVSSDGVICVTTVENGQKSHVMPRKRTDRWLWGRGLRKCASPWWWKSCLSWARRENKG